MIDERRLFEQAERVFAAPVGSFDALVRLRERRTRRRRVAAAVLALAIAVAAVGGAISVFRGVERRTPADAITPDSAADLGLLGRVAVGESRWFPSQWRVPGGMVVESGGSLAVYSTDCGGEGGCAVLWRTPPLGRLSLRPILLDDVILVGGADGGIQAFPVRCAPGEDMICEPAWTLRARLPADPWAVVSAGSLVVSDGGRLFAFTLPCDEPDRTCGPLWRSPELGRTFRVHAVGDLVVLHTKERRLFGFSATCRPVDGVCEPLWELDKRTSAHFDPVMRVGDRLLFRAFNQREESFPVLPADCVGTCSMQGSWVPPEPVVSPSRFSPDQLHVLDDTVLVWWTEPRRYAGIVEVPRRCFGLPDCEPLWVSRFDVRVYEPTMVVDEEGGVVAVGLAATDPSRGRILTFPLSCRTDGGTCAPLAEIHSNEFPNVVRNGVVYANDYYQGLSAYPVECEAPCEAVWSYPVDVDMPVEVTDDRVVVGSHGHLLVFGLDETAPAPEEWAPWGVYPVLVLAIGLAVLVGLGVRLSGRRAGA